MARTARPDAPPRRGPSPVIFGVCSGAVGAAIAALGVFSADFLVAASEPAGTLEPGLGLGLLSTLLVVALFVGGPVGMLGGLVLAGEHPERAERLASAVYPLTSLAVPVVLGSMFLVYFLSA